MKLRSEVSPFIRKLQAAPEGYWFEPEVRPPNFDVLVPRTGLYFFYGTLSDPSLLAEILSLDESPTLRPSKVVGYSLKLWGQYPALVDGPTDGEVMGFACEIKEQKHVNRLAEYETKNYRSTPCLVYPRDAEAIRDNATSGFTFKFCGNPIDLDEGNFDLPTWLRRMGRL